MHYHIYCNQKHLNHNHLLAIEEYKKRLSAYCETTLHVDTALCFSREINSKNHQFIFVQSGPSTFSSEQLAGQISNLQTTGKSTIHVVVGYDAASFYGAVSSLTDYSTPLDMALSNSSLSNQTKTLLFFEQLYRAYTILQGKTYHK